MVYIGRRWCTPHLAGIQSGGETPDRRAGTICFGRDGRAGNQEDEVGERGSGSGAAACQTGLQSATANAETSRPPTVAVRPASRKQQTPQQQGQRVQRVQQGLRWRPRCWRRAWRPRPRTRPRRQPQKELASLRESNKRESNREMLCFIFT